MNAGDAVRRGPITVARVSTIAQACDRFIPSSRIFATIARSTGSWAAAIDDAASEARRGTARRKYIGRCGLRVFFGGRSWQPIAGNQHRAPPCARPLSVPAANRMMTLQATSLQLPNEPGPMSRPSASTEPPRRLARTALVFVWVAGAGLGAQQPVPQGLPERKNWTAAQDHQQMMDQLGIKALRPGPSGNEQEPNHANYDEAKANPFPKLPEVLTLENGRRVTTPELWARRRREIVELFERDVFGRVPR